MEKAFEKSFRSLGLEYVDLYIMHFPVIQRKESWKIMEKIAKSGKCRAIGVSNFTIRHLQGIMETAEIIPAVNQVEFTPILYQKELLDFCTKNKIAVEAYSPLTNGRRLTDSRFTKIAFKYKKSNAQLLIRWCLQHGIITIPKSKSKVRIFENFDVFDFDISKEDMQALDDMNENARFCWDPSTAP